jgi:hypothetical protein
MRKQLFGCFLEGAIHVSTGGVRFPLHRLENLLGYPDVVSHDRRELYHPADAVPGGGPRKTARAAEGVHRLNELPIF